MHNVQPAQRNCEFNSIITVMVHRGFFEDNELAKFTRGISKTVWETVDASLSSLTMQIPVPGLDKFKGVKHLIISPDKYLNLTKLFYNLDGLTKKTFCQISTLNHLESLWLNRLGLIESTDLSAITCLRDLRELNLCRLPKLNDEIVEIISKVPILNKLGIEKCEGITTCALSQIIEFPTISHLRIKRIPNQKLSYINITDHPFAVDKTQLEKFQVLDLDYVDSRTFVEFVETGLSNQENLTFRDPEDNDFTVEGTYIEKFGKIELQMHHLRSLIGNFSNLQTLKIGPRKDSRNITLDLRLLLKLPQLAALDIRGMELLNIQYHGRPHIDPSQLHVLDHLQKLKKLKIGSFGHKNNSRQMELSIARCTQLTHLVGENLILQGFLDIGVIGELVNLEILKVKEDPYNPNLNFFRRSDLKIVRLSFPFLPKLKHLSLRCIRSSCCNEEMFCLDTSFIINRVYQTSLKLLEVQKFRLQHDNLKEIKTRLRNTTIRLLGCEIISKVDFTLL